MIFGNVECLVSLVRMTLRRSPSSKRAMGRYCASKEESEGGAYHEGRPLLSWEGGPEHKSAVGLWRVSSMGNTTLRSEGTGNSNTRETTNEHQLPVPPKS